LKLYLHNIILKDTSELLCPTKFLGGKKGFQIELLVMTEKDWESYKENKDVLHSK